MVKEIHTKNNTEYVYIYVFFLISILNEYNNDAYICIWILLVSHFYSSSFLLLLYFFLFRDLLYALKEKMLIMEKNKEFHYFISNIYIYIFLIIIIIIINIKFIKESI